MIFNKKNNEIEVKQIKNYNEEQNERFKTLLKSNDILIDFIDNDDYLMVYDELYLKLNDYNMLINYLVINNNEKEILLDDYNEIIKKVIININKKENLINIFEEINKKIVDIKSSGKKILNSYFINKELDKIIEIIGIENIYE